MRHFLFCLILTGLSTQAIAQNSNELNSIFTGGIGLTVIDGKTYYLMNTQPEFAFGNWGVGLDLNFRVGTDGSIRSEDWDEFYDIIRVVRYVRYGQKRAPLYVRVGQLDNSRIGRGLLMYGYSNGISYDNRKVGVEFDMRFEKWGFESVSSNVTGAEIWGGRAYFLPLAETGIPIIKDLELGGSLIADLDENARKLNDNDLGFITEDDFKTDKPVTGVAIDAGLPIIDNSFADLILYTELGSLLGYGGGANLGFESNLKGLGQFLSIGLRFEQRFNGDQFLANYFGPFYEVERYKSVGNGLFATKLQTLKDVNSAGSGYYGSLLATFLGTFKIIGSYEEQSDVSNSGLLHVGTDLGDMISNLVARADYYKRGITAGTSIFKLDDRSLMSAEIGYKPNSFTVVSIYYQWTFKPIKDGTKVVDYETVSKVEPKISFIFRF